jgi:hypothetical protein
MSSSALSERRADPRPLAERVLFLDHAAADDAADFERADVVCLDVSGMDIGEAHRAAFAAVRKGLPVVAEVATGDVERTEAMLAAGCVHVLDVHGADGARWAVLACAARMSDRWSSRAATRHARVFLRGSVLECRTPDEAYDMASVLCALFAMPQNAMTGLVELLMNAIEHGNLEIDHDEKTALMQSGTLYDEIARRLREPPYRDRKVTVRVDRNDDGSGIITIRDDGRGFDWRAHLAAIAGTYQGRGRGIELARELSFPDLEFLDPGNQVVVRVPAAS